MMMMATAVLLLSGVASINEGMYVAGDYRFEVNVFYERRRLRLRFCIDQ
jgi:hypothetical protein